VTRQNILAYVYISSCLFLDGIWVSSVSIVSDYRHDYGATGVRFPAEAKYSFSSPCVQTSSLAHPASYPMGTGDPCPGGKTRPGRDADHEPYLLPKSRTSRSYTLSLVACVVVE